MANEVTAPLERGARYVPPEEDPERLKKWHETYNAVADPEGWMEGIPEKKGLPVTDEKFLQNIRDNAKLDLPVLMPKDYDKRTFVYVGGAPSAGEFLQDIREKVEDREHYLVTCSNQTAKWLLEHGITPHVQFVVDPQEKKKKDVEHKNPDIEYWLSLNVDPEVYKTVQGLNVKRFVSACSLGENRRLDLEVAKEEMGGKDIMVIGGGTTAGLRSLNLADNLGFRKMHIYGMDSSVKQITDQEYQHYIYKKDRKETILEVMVEDGTKFLSTPVFGKQIDQFIECKHKMPHIEFTVFGDGLLPHQNRVDDERTKSFHRFDGRWSEEYEKIQREEQKQKDYGMSGGHYAHFVNSLLSQMRKKYGPITVLDYACGKGSLKKTLEDRFSEIPGVEYRMYDPFIDEHSKEPEPVDVVVCTDVLEHVEPQYVRSVIDHIHSLTRRVAFISVDTIRAVKTLPDGRNAHLSVHPHGWWYGEMKRKFHLLESRLFYQKVVFVAMPAEHLESITYSPLPGQGKARQESNPVSS